MIANNIFKAIGDFCTNVLFKPFDALRSMDNWWLQTSISWVFIVITFIAFIYWLSVLKKNQKAEIE
ncbi:MAG: uracil phosphoribosyltransferase [Lutibacter sp.]|uniref:DUF6341 family protein n=1 Tax=Lutibacter sp. TaxID=1925666 RepID=UPI0038583C39